MTRAPTLTPWAVAAPVTLQVRVDMTTTTSLRLPDELKSRVADAAQISGTVDGTVAAKSLVIEASARINGDLSYDAVSVASGAQVEGRVKRLTRDAEPALKLIASE